MIFRPDKALECFRGVLAVTKEIPDLQSLQGAVLNALAQAVSNPCLAQIVRRHLQTNSITYRQPNEMLSHFAAQMGQHFVLVVEFDSEHCPGKNG